MPASCVRRFVQRFHRKKQGGLCLPFLQMACASTSHVVRAGEARHFLHTEPGHHTHAAHRMHFGAAAVKHRGPSFPKDYFLLGL